MTVDVVVVVIVGVLNMYDKFNELALKSDKEECKELELCCFLSDYPIKDFNEIMEMV